MRPYIRLDPTRQKNHTCGQQAEDAHRIASLPACFACFACFACYALTPRGPLSALLAWPSHQVTQFFFFSGLCLCKQTRPRLRIGLFQGHLKRRLTRRDSVWPSVDPLVDQLGKEERRDTTRSGLSAHLCSRSRCNLSRVQSWASNRVSRAKACDSSKYPRFRPSGQHGAASAPSTSVFPQCKTSHSSNSGPAYQRHVPMASQT